MVTLALLPDLSGATGYLWAHGLLPVRPLLLTLLGLGTVSFVALARDLRRTAGAELVNCYRLHAPIVAGLAIVVAVRLLWILHPGSLWVASGYYAAFPAYGLVLFLLLLPVVLVPGVARHYRIVVLAPYVVVVATMVADVVHPGIFSKNVVQAAGLLGNPNFGAGLLIALTIAVLEWRWRDGRDWLLWYVTAPLIVMTGSRMGALMCLCTGLWWLSLPPRAGTGGRPGFGRVAGLALGLGTGAAALVGWMTVDREAAGWVLDKMTSFLHPEALAGGIRAGLLKHYLAVAAQAPFLGHGVDFWMQNRWGAHDTYVAFLVSYGVLGLLVLSIFYLVAFWNFRRIGNRRGMVFVVVILGIQSGFMDLLLDMRFVLMLLALICSAGYVEWARPQGLSVNRGRASEKNGKVTA